MLQHWIRHLYLAIDECPNTKDDLRAFLGAAAYRGPLGRRVVLCDNSKHSFANSSQSAIDSKQCPYCRSVVYCSPRCQAEDWEHHGGTECSGLNTYRIDLERRSAWISHKTRTFYLYLLQQLLLNRELGLPTEAVCGTLSEDRTTLTYTHSAPEPSDEPTKRASTGDQFLNLDTTQTPCKVYVKSVDDEAKYVKKMWSSVPRFKRVYLDSLQAMMESSETGEDTGRHTSPWNVKR